MNNYNNGNIINNDRQYHYEFVDLRTCDHDKIPDKTILLNNNPNWLIKIQSQAGRIWNLFTPSGLHLPIASASLQAAIRQGMVYVTIQWIREMIRTDGPLDRSRIGKGENNLWTRLITIVFEDIGLANPYCTILAHKAMVERTKFTNFLVAEKYAIDFGVMLARSVKSRAVDWACISRFKVPTTPSNNTGSNNDIMYFNDICNNLFTSLMIGDHINSIAYAHKITVMSLQDKANKVSDPLPKEWFNSIKSGLPHYKNKRQAIWAILISVMNKLISTVQNSVIKNKYVNDQYRLLTYIKSIVVASYEVSHENQFRWKKSSRLMEHMAVLMICFRTSFDERYYSYIVAENAEPQPSVESINDIIYKDPYYMQNMWFGVADICKDKHTAEGAKMKRWLQHFVEIKSFLRHESPELMALSDFYLDKAFDTRYRYEIKDSKKSREITEDDDEDDDDEVLNSDSNPTNPIFDVSNMTIDEYRAWIPTLRSIWNDMNRVTDMIKWNSNKAVTFTITYCESCENHVGMQKLGTIAQEGFTCQELKNIAHHYANGAGRINGVGANIELIDLKQTLLNGIDVSSVDDACLLIIRNGVNYFWPEINNLSPADRLLLQLSELDWDKKAMMYGKVVNKNARWNLCFADVNQEPDYENGKGRVYNFNNHNVSVLNSIRVKLGIIFGQKANNLYAEGNYYHDSKSFIGQHGDAERKIVIGVRTGKSMKLNFQWYQNSEVKSQMFTTVLNHGDIYIFSNKSVGTDWKKKKIFTLRHSANY